MTTKRLLFALCCLSLLASPAVGQTIRVLVTNDDGIGAPGIAAHGRRAAAQSQSHRRHRRARDQPERHGGCVHHHAVRRRRGHHRDRRRRHGRFGQAGRRGDVGRSSRACCRRRTSSCRASTPGQNIGRFIAEDLSGTVGAASVAARRGVPGHRRQPGAGRHRLQSAGASTSPTSSKTSAPSRAWQEDDVEDRARSAPAAQHQLSRLRERVDQGRRGGAARRVAGSHRPRRHRLHDDRARIPIRPVLVDERASPSTARRRWRSRPPTSRRSPTASSA